ncbi:dihydrodipicolinate synthase family protein [Gordonia sp. zg691]|uniref:dihydrodipicolinate synthase family protein n=1 Tax=Gordonia jinghuaiqii TaxID=2758710 RepID=UPI0016623DF3|nr:dihydrodipicolinate synthase family protein [Gordonia jinghuaiqii]MBD0860418.1 dihydrodipicolinate synthase family protein [Gordonia jinghuaiqii]
MSHTLPPTGIIGAALTPFTEDNDVDQARLDSLLDIMVGHCDAISLLGAEVSEYQILDETTRLATLRASIDTVGKRVPVLAGASHSDVAGVLRLAESAADAGADFIQVLMPRHPGGNPAGIGDLTAYFERIAASSPLPIIAYHNPSQGTDTDAPTMAELARIDGVVGFKESSRDLTKIGRLCAEIDSAGHARYYTTMQALQTTLLLGGSGAMMPPPGTAIGAQVVAAYREDDHTRAAQWQRHFRQFPGLWGKHGLTTIMKAAMAALGHDLGGPAAPFRPMPSADSEHLAQHLDSLDLDTLFPVSASAGTTSKGHGS